MFVNFNLNKNLILDDIQKQLITEKEEESRQLN